METCAPFVFCHFLMVTMSIPLPRDKSYFRHSINNPLFQAEECTSCCFHIVRLASGITMQSINLSTQKGQSELVAYC